MRTSPPGVRKQATRARGRDRRRARRHGAGARARGRRLRRRDAARAAAGASGALAGACSRRSRCGGCSRAARPRERRVLRFYGVGESAVAQALAAAGGDGDGVEVTICARDSEIHVDLFVEPGRRGAGRRARGGARRAARAVPVRARPRQPIEELVLERCRERGLTLATAESCTGGLVAARLTSVAGLERRLRRRDRRVLRTRSRRRSSACPREVLEAHGAVSAETAVGDGARRARAARRRRRGVGDGDRRARRRDAREAGRARLPLRVRARRASARATSRSRRPRDGAPAGHRRARSHLLHRLVTEM